MDEQQQLQSNILELLHHDRERGAELLLETYTPLLWSICRRRLSDPEDIKECINDVFFGFCIDPDQYDPDQSSLKNYLAMLTDRRAISYYRSNQRRLEAESSISIIDGFDHTELHSELNEALDHLQPDDAHILRMKYYNGLTYREIAQQMGITEEAAKKRGKRSLKKMAKWLLLGLLIAAVLAGCALVTHHYLTYVRGSGVIPSDPELPIYQMQTPPEPFVVNNSTIHLLSASCVGNSLTAVVIIQPDPKLSDTGFYSLLSECYDLTVNESSVLSASTSSDFLNKYFGEISTDLLVPDDSGLLHLDISLSLLDYMCANLESQFQYEFDTSVPQWHITMEPVESLQNFTETDCYLDTQHADFLVFTDMDIPDDSGDSYTFISLCPVEVEDGLSISPLFSTCPTPLNDGNQGFITLSDSSGTSYRPFRTITPSPGSEITEFTLCFRNLPPGEYTLHFPSICYRMEQSPVVLQVPLPNSDDIPLMLDETVSLTEGSSIHFTGVSRETDSQTSQYMTEHFVNGKQEWVLEEDTMTLWDYRFDFTISTNDDFPLFGIFRSNEYCYIASEGTKTIRQTSGMHNDSISLSHLRFGIRDSFGMNPPDLLKITLQDFYYLDPSNYTLPIIVK